MTATEIHALHVAAGLIPLALAIISFACHYRWKESAKRAANGRRCEFVSDDEC